MRAFAFFIRYTILFLAITVAMMAAQTAPPSVAPIQQHDSKPLSDADIVSLVKGGLAESTILLAIEQNPTAFETSPFALVELKNQGVPSAVIDAMLRSKDAASTPASTPPTSMETPKDSFSSLAEGTFYKSSDGMVKLQPLMMAGGGATHMGKMFIPGMTPQFVHTFRGAEAPIQIKERTPVFYVKQSPYMVNIPGHSDRDIVLVRFDKKKDHRELQTTSGGSAFNFKAGFSKEKTPDIVVTRVSDSVFTVTPKGSLPPGEYMLTYGMGVNGFDFGVTDRQ
jgi:hypothetical protein